MARYLERQGSEFYEFSFYFIFLRRSARDTGNPEMPVVSDKKACVL